LGARDQEDRDSSTAQTNGLQDLILKIPNAKKGWQSGLRGRKEEKKEGRNVSCSLGNSPRLWSIWGRGESQRKFQEDLM
jgi:hypothetical protein